MRRIALLLLVISTVGCVGRINKTMDSWVGHHFSELIASWGPPAQVFEDGSGGRVMVWTINRTFVSPGTSQTTFQATQVNNQIWGQATTTYNPAHVSGYTATRTFWVRKNGRVYKWAWKGL